VLLDQPQVFFNEEGLSKNGKDALKAMNDGDLFLIIKDFDPEQTKSLLKRVRKPLLILTENIPEKSVLESVKKSDSAVGLIWGDEEPAVYVKKLSELKEALGTGSIVFVKESCLWSDKTKEALLDVFLEIAKADFDRRALSNIFSGNLMRIIDLARGIQDSGFSF
jgi:hypothetical protein